MGLLENRVAAELAQWAGFKQAGLDQKKIAESLARPPKSDMGDLALGCFKFAKEAGSKPNDFAAQLVVAKPATSTLIANAEAAGPYVNLRLNRAAACQAALTAIESATPGNDPANWRFGDSDSGRGRRLLVDFSSPNIAKPLAVHHLRSTMIGNAIKNIRWSQGWLVFGVNHLGDWGTAFGKLVAGLKRYYPGAKAKSEIGDADPLGTMTIGELVDAYRRFTSEASNDPKLEEQGRQAFADMEWFMRNLGTDHQAKPTDARSISGMSGIRIWQQARRISLHEFERIYKRLGITFLDWSLDADQASQDLAEILKLESRDAQLSAFAEYQHRTNYHMGEAAYVIYMNELDGILAEGLRRGVVTESDGAKVIFVHGEKRPPVIILKSDGATSYHARDIIAAAMRRRVFSFEEMAYVVGAEQSLHFEQLFAALKQLGYEWADKCHHVPFGLMLFKQPDNTWAKGSTRKGTAIMLEDLLDEAIQGVREIIAEKNPELAADKSYAEQVAQAVGTGAVVFNDLKQGRRNNIKFDWDAVLDFQGESGPYMQMQYVRMCSVLDKFVAESEQRFGRKLSTEDLGAADVALLTHEEEWKIVLQLAAFPDAIAKASEEFEPSVVSRYLIELASLTSTWWTVTKDTRIVGDDPALSLARVRLVNAIRKVLGRGLTLLGMSLVERM